GTEAEVDSRYIVSHVLEKNFTWLKTWHDSILSNDQQVLLGALVERRKSGEPIAYITGEKDFWTLALEVNPSTLIPRPETELLVETALEFLANKSRAKILDLGTGTGAIALAIASERNNDVIIASDYVVEAVQLAQRNAVKNKIENVTFIQSDWFSNVKEAEFDLIVSNPPYVEENDPHLNQSDLRFEPNSALIAADNGFADIKTIIHEAKNHLVKNGVLLMEHGFEQGERVRSLLSEAAYGEIKTLADHSGLDRVTIAINSIASLEDAN
ncbi:MAG: peptide chain release factor N(5)-glutamine methyltransferase, partial [Kangiellaceae bacterium]|nr:peptide chain release factor N(5)-glutamine methyltransferase [Kangiellaceae bacterium]